MSEVDALTNFLGSVRLTDSHIYAIGGRSGSKGKLVTCRFPCIHLIYICFKHYINLPDTTFFIVIIFYKLKNQWKDMTGIVMSGLHVRICCPKRVTLVLPPLME